jgi:hypothetical protein
MIHEDSWDHRILVEKISEPEPDTSYPICIKGKRAYLPQDVGVIWGYGDFLETMGNSDNPTPSRHDGVVGRLF